MANLQGTDKAPERSAATTVAAGAAMTATGAQSQKPVVADMAALKTQDETLHAIAQDILDHLKYTIMAAANGQGGSGNEIADACRAFVASRRPKAQAAYKAKAGQLLATAASRKTEFGRFASIEPSAILAQKLTDASAKAGPASFMKAGSLTADKLHAVELPNDIRLDKKKDAPKGKPKPEDPDLVAGLKYKQMEFYIGAVHCVESTGGLLEGSDETELGGVVIGATGKVVKISRYSVAEMDDNTTHTYPGGKSFWKYALVTNEKWPQVYTATVALADRDDGGFGDFLESLWDKVGSYVSAAVGAAGGAALGALLGSAIPGLGTVIGAVVGALFGWLVSLFHNADDIIGVRTSTMHLGAATKSYYDWAKLTTAAGWTQTLDFHEEGQYRVDVGWRLVKP